MLQMPQVTGSKKELGLQLLQGSLPLRQQTAPQGWEASPGDREGQMSRKEPRGQRQGFLRLPEGLVSVASVTSVSESGDLLMPAGS